MRTREIALLIFILETVFLIGCQMSFSTAEIDDYIHGETNSILKTSILKGDSLDPFRVDNFVTSPYLIHLNHDSFKFEIVVFGKNEGLTDLVIESVTIGPDAKLKSNIESTPVRLSKHKTKDICWSRTIAFKEISKKTIAELEISGYLPVSVAIKNTSNKQVKKIDFRLKKQTRRYQVQR